MALTITAPCSVQERLFSPHQPRVRAGERPGGGRPGQPGRRGGSRSGGAGGRVEGPLAGQVQEGLHVGQIRPEIPRDQQESLQTFLCRCSGTARNCSVI